MSVTSVYDLTYFPFKFMVSTLHQEQVHLIGRSCFTRQSQAFFVQNWRQALLQYVIALHFKLTEINLQNKIFRGR